jgi:DNA-directed RNA polymerase specialized sigma24 family protein
MPAAAARMAEPFDELTLRRAQRGEETAWRALIERYHAPVHAEIRRMLAAREPHRAEDLVQETFLRVLRALGNDERVTRRFGLVRLEVACDR